MSVIDDLYKKIDEGREGKNIGLKTGLSKIDWYTGGLQKSNYKLIFGQSGSAKSSYVIYTDLYRILKDYPNKDIIHIYYSLEMSSNVLLGKLLNLYIAETYGVVISYMDLMSIRKVLSDHYYQYILLAKEWLNSISNKLIIFDKELDSDTFYGSMKELLKSWGTFTWVDNGRRLTYTPKNPERLVNVIIDHMGLLSPKKGRNKKEEIDECSKRCVWFRETCGISFDIIMQENRNAGSMDRRKADLSESTAEDIKDSGNCYNDCNICLAIYYPLKYQLSTYRGYNVSGENGLGSAIRSIILLKHRFGNANKVFPLGFQGSIGKFTELPPPDQIDYFVYQSWKKDDEFDTNKTKDVIVEDVNIEDNKSKAKFHF